MTSSSCSHKRKRQTSSVNALPHKSKARTVVPVSDKDFFGSIPSPNKSNRDFSGQAHRKKARRAVLMLIPRTKRLQFRMLPRQSKEGHRSMLMHIQSQKRVDDRRRTTLPLAKAKRVVTMLIFTRDGYPDGCSNSKQRETLR